MILITQWYNDKTIIIVEIPISITLNFEVEVIAGLP